METIFEFISFLYINFSFPLFFLIFIFVFRKNIINLSERLISIEKTNDGAKFNFADATPYFKQVDNLERNVKAEYGNEILNQKAGGGGDTGGDISDALLIYNSDVLQKHYAKFGAFKTVEDLYISYKTLKKLNDQNLVSSGCDLTILNDDYVIEANKLIKDFYNFSLEARFSNELLQEKDIFGYQNLIKKTIILRQNLCINAEK